MTGVRSYGALGTSLGRAQVAALSGLTLFYAAIVAWLVQLPYDIAGGVLVVHLLAVVTVPVLLWLERDGHRAAPARPARARGEARRYLGPVRRPAERLRRRRCA